MVGAGNVSGTHAEALATLPGADLVAVCDPVQARAQKLAEDHGIPHIFGSIPDAISSGTFNSAHVLVPPDQHLLVARDLVEAGIDVLIEKPMGLSAEDCEDLSLAARSRGAIIGVNHNAVFFPAYLRLRQALLQHSLGPLQHVAVVVNFPRSTLGSASHWMHRHPRNLAFESAIHPLSQIYDLAGPVQHLQTTVSGRKEIAPGQHYYETWQVSLVCERASAQLFLSYGGAYRMWQVTAICEDGSLTAEVEQNRLSEVDRARWGRGYEPLYVAGKVATHEIGQGIANFSREAVSVVKPVPRKDTYFLSMRSSIGRFHGTGSDGPECDGSFGTQVVRMCQEATAPLNNEESRPRAVANGKLNGKCDVAVLGGTGFIGRALMSQLVAEGRTVRVMARNTVGLPDLFTAPEVRVLQGDITDPDAIRRASRGAQSVVHLAHGGSFTWEDIEATMVRPAREVAQSALRADVGRVIYAGTIASLYLGDPDAVITGATPTDPRARERGPYEWGKALSEQCLKEFANRESLPLCVVRPGVVLGEGGTPFHSGFGIWRADVHCVGWNAGKNPLPVVLATDVARAIVLALDSAAAVSKSYNLVGDVRPSARECVRELRQVMQRPIVFHPMIPAQHQAWHASKWLAKMALGRPRVPFPSYRTVKSMGCVSRFDCADVKQDLGWDPVGDREDFFDRALRIHQTR